MTTPVNFHNSDESVNPDVATIKSNLNNDNSDTLLKDNRENNSNLEMDSNVDKVLSKTTGEKKKKKKKKRKTERCAFEGCRTKLKITCFACKCKKKFCIMHRNAEKHDCEFDYKAANRKMMEGRNPVIKFSKLETI